MKLGGKFTDLIYTTSTQNPTLLILSKKSALTQTDQIALSIRNYLGKLSKEQRLEMMKQYCQEVPSLEFLETCGLLSTLHFTVKPFVLATGTITAENVDAILGNAGKNKIIESQKATLIGREFVTFKEASIEFQNDTGMVKGGPATHSYMGATYDRVQRGLLVFNMWLRNLDAKDENNRGQIVKNYLDSDKVYLETQHDMGVTLGGLFSSGFANNFTDDNFVTEGPGMFELAFNQFMPFIPKAWTSATFSDVLWMGEKIARLTRADISEIVSSSKWPSFIQAEMVNKLMVRRNHIAKGLKIEHLLDEKKIKEPTIKYSLKNQTEIQKVASELNLSTDLITKALVDNKLKNYEDVVIKNGRIQSCSSSLIINLLEKANNPSGLSRRNPKTKNHKDLPICEFIP